MVDKEVPKYNIKVNINDFDVLQTVGTGTFGRVRLCKHKKTNKIYVLKILKKAEIIRLKQVDHIYSEYNILSILNHPFIVELKGVNVTDPKYLYFILEYVAGGELFTLLRSSNVFPLEQAKFYAAHIITIFEYLHGKNIIYRDLKPENILINSNGYLKLTDFGFAKSIEGKTYTLCGTPEYLAPEIILNKGHSKPVDWWTLGILFYEMIIGIDPFNDEDPMLIYQKIIKGKVRFPNTIDKDAKSLIKHLLTGDTTKRFGCLKNGVKDIIDHRLYKNFDWRGLVFLKMEAPYLPKIKNASDTSNFSNYPDSTSEVVALKNDKDPFRVWMDSMNKDVSIPEIEIVKSTDDEGNKYINGYKKLRLLGKGSYSTVKLVEKEGLLFAMKTINKSILQRKNKGFFKNESGQVVVDSLLENAMREIAILKKCQNDNVIKLYEIIIDNTRNKIYLILEFCQNGVLMETKEDDEDCFDDEEVPEGPSFKLNSHFKKDNYSEDEIRDFVRDIVMGLDYLHHNGIIHRDIKPDNIILDEFNHCKITDFNVSSMLKNSDDDKIGKKIEGTDSFRAPECCGEKAIDLSGKPLDIWALGITSFILAYKDLPFKSEDEMDIMGLFDKISEADVVFPSTREISEGFTDFIQKCLIKDPEKRITIEEIKILPWINIKRTPLIEMKKPELISITHSEVTNSMHFFGTIQLVKKCAEHWKKKLSLRPFKKETVDNIQSSSQSISISNNKNNN